MYQCPPRSAQVWGDLVRDASAHGGRWPTISFWHGGADATVIPPNAIEIVKQWTDVHGLPTNPSFTIGHDGYTRQVWVNATGDELIESYSISNMAHGTPLATGKADEQCGTAGPFLLEVGISSSYHIAKFLGLTGPSGAGTSTPSFPESIVAGIVGRDVVLQPGGLDGEVLGDEVRIQENSDIHATSKFDISATITKALKAAGLVKDN
jgi:feruloyl esterase